MGKENKDQEGLKWSDKVKFYPWIGENYKNGVVGYYENGIIQYGESEGEGKKILVLGESHYCYDESEAIPELTNDIIKDLIAPESEWEPYKNTYTKFIKSLTGYIDELDDEVKKEAWQHIAFYNYVQEPITGPRIAPSKEDFSNSVVAFEEILDKLNPDLVIIWGKRLYNNLPQDLVNYKGDNLEDLEAKIYDYLFEDIEIWSYKGEKLIVFLPIVHPAAAMFEIYFWSKVIQGFIVKKYE